ncbi:hypothetical protein F750_3738 [Streptomyces sp. PAMC 26508]|nr:hypothetical protein F750_3738 [Streptomyces sp. PAMC 26508]
MSDRLLGGTESLGKGVPDSLGRGAGLTVAGPRRNLTGLPPSPPYGGGGPHGPPLGIVGGRRGVLTRRPRPGRGRCPVGHSDRRDVSRSRSVCSPPCPPPPFRPVRRAMPVPGAAVTPAPAHCDCTGRTTARWRGSAYPAGC